MKFIGLVAHAQTIGLIENIKTAIVNPIISILIALALVMFVYGVMQFVAGGDDEVRRTAGRKHMMWGIIGLFIMVSVFGIINVITVTLDSLF